MDEKTVNAVVLAVISLAYVIVLSIVSKSNETFMFGLVPLIIVIIGFFGYKFKAKFAGGEIDIEKVMKEAKTISGNKNIGEAEKLMESEGVDFLNVVDDHGKFIGVFTKADAHRARRERKARAKIKDYMTPYENVVKVRRREKLKDAVEKITESKHTKLPVIDGEKVVGVVDSVDIMKKLFG